jgi:hypothetical protein
MAPPFSESGIVGGLKALLPGAFVGLADQRESKSLRGLSRLKRGAGKSGRDSAFRIHLFDRVNRRNGGKRGAVFLCGEDRSSDDF